MTQQTIDTTTTTQAAPRPAADKMAAREEALIAKMRATPGTIELPEATGKAARVEQAIANGFVESDTPPNPVEEADGEDPSEETQEDVSDDQQTTARETPGAKKSATLERLAALERKQHERREARARELADVTQRQQQLEARERALQEREKAWEDPTSVLDYLEKNVGIEKLVEWASQHNDPQRRAQLAAQRAAREAASPVEKELRELKERIAGYEHRAQIEASENQFAQLVLENEAEAPHAARALKADRRYALDRAHAIAYAFTKRGIRWHPADIALALEKELGGVAKLLSPSAGKEGATNQDTEQGQSGAKGMAKTITNRAAATRTTGSNGAPKLSYEERQARLARRLRNTP